MSGHRQAALALYGLDEHDRQAILAELPADDQTTLRGLLDELRELGFETSAAASAGVLAGPQREGTADQGTIGGDVRPVLRRAAPEVMLALLRHEPVSLQACFLSIERWPWTSGFLDLLPPQRRAQVRGALHDGFAPAPARDRFLLETVAAGLQSAQAANAPVRRGWFSHTIARLSPWTR